MRLTAILAGLFTASMIIGAGSPTIKAQSHNAETELPKTIKVESGDTLSKIAKAFDTTYLILFDANTKIKDPDLIYAGDTLRIPHPDEKFESREITSSEPVQVPVQNQPVANTETSPAPAPKPQTESTQPTPAPAPITAPQTTSTSVWDKLAMCESSGNWSIDTGNGYYGGLQFTLSSWRAVGGSGYPHQASKAEQIARAEKLLAIQGWGAWPACSAKLGLY